MSRLKIVLSREADQDLKDILQYTLTTWGVAQMDVYAAAIDKGLKLLVANPRASGAPEMTSLLAAALFRWNNIRFSIGFDALVLSIARILHQGMNTKRHVKAIA